MKALLVSVVVVCSVCATGVASAGDTTSHTVTVTVSGASELTINGARLSLLADEVSWRSAPERATNEKTCDLVWMTSEAATKITAETGVAAPISPLVIEAVNLTGGTTASAHLPLSTTPRDLVIGDSAWTGSCDLRYAATITPGTGSDVHTVLYTITAQ